MSENDIIIVDNVVELESLNKNDKVIIEDMTGRNKDDLIKYIKNEDKFLELLYQLDEKEDMEKLLKIRLISEGEVPLSKILFRNKENIEQFSNIGIKCRDEEGYTLGYLGIEKIADRGRNVKFKLNKEEGILFFEVEEYTSIIYDYRDWDTGGIVIVEQEYNPKFINLIVDIVYDKNERSKKARSYFEL